MLDGAGTGDEVFVTGGTGFIGSHVVRALVDAGYRVRALVRGGADRLPRVACTPVPGDVDRSGELARQMEGCRYLVHVAAVYSFAPRDRARMWATNVRGCAGVLAAAHLAGVERAVVTSSSATVGPARDGRPSNETSHDGSLAASAYHASKAAMERVALAARLPVALVLPTAPVGPADARPTPTGQMIVDFLRGRIFATVDGGMNVVAVEDVARAHIQALTHGRAGERYLVGGENLSFDEIWRLLADVCGRPAPRLRLPHPVVLATAAADELRCRVLKRDPAVPLEGARLARHQMYVDDAKARRDLGHRPSSVPAALERAVRWYRDNGYAA